MNTAEITVTDRAAYGLEPLPLLKQPTSDPINYRIPVYKVTLIKEAFIKTDQKHIGGPKDIANILMPSLRNADREHMVVLLLDTKNVVRGINTVSIGDLSSAIVHPREVFKAAILASAASIIVAHNHPSGDPTPSSEDVVVTKRLISAGEIIGIDVLDHVIIGDNLFVSLKERGLI